MALNDIIVSIPAMTSSYRVGLLCYHGCMNAGLLAFADLLRAADDMIAKLCFEVIWLNIEDTPMPEVDLIIVPSFWARSTTEINTLLGKQKKLISFLRTQGAKKEIWAYCTGVAVLAEAGRLNAEPATITWWAIENMKKRHPSVNWQPERDHVINNRNATASGVMGYLPLALALIERKSGERIARDVSRLMVLPRPTQIHPAFQAFSLIEQAAPLMRALHRVATSKDATSLTATYAAKQMNVSERTLQRKVKNETGQSLGRVLRKIKLSQVANYVSETDRTAGFICDDLGFSSESNMRRMFKEETGLTLTEYRNYYGGTY